MEELAGIKSKYRETAYNRAVLVNSFLEFDPARTVKGSKEFINHFLPLHPDLVELLEKIPSPSTFYRWVRSYLNSGRNIATLAPRYQDGDGAGSKALTEKEQSVLLMFWMTPAAWSVKKCIDEAEKALGHKISYATALRYLDSQPKAYRYAFRSGRKKVNDKVMPYIERNPAFLASMEQVTSDHHMLDFFVQKDGKVFRPWITAFTDLRSRKVLSWVMCENPNKLTVLHTLQIMTHEFGIPEKLIFDNGKDYRSELLRGGFKEVKGFDYELIDKPKKIELQGVFGSLGCKVIYAEPYHGQSKPIERWFRTLAERFSKEQATYCGSNTATRPDEAKLYHQTIGQMKKKDVVLSFDEAYARLNCYIDEYNSTWEHTGKGMDGNTPDFIFKANLKGKRILHDSARRRIFTEAEIRTVSREGVQIESTYFYNTDMMELIGQKVIVRKPLYSDAFVIICDLDDRELMSAVRDLHGDTGDVTENNNRKKSAHKEIRSKIKHFEDKIRQAKGLPEIEEYEIQKAAKHQEYLEEYKKAVGAENESNPSLLGGTSRPYRKPKPHLHLLG